MRQDILTDWENKAIFPSQKTFAVALSKFTLMFVCISRVRQYTVFIHWVDGNVRRLRFNSGSGVKGVEMATVNLNQFQNYLNRISAKCLIICIRSRNPWWVWYSQRHLELSGICVEPGVSTQKQETPLPVQVSASSWTKCSPIWAASYDERRKVRSSFC